MSIEPALPNLVVSFDASNRMFTFNDAADEGLAVTGTSTVAPFYSTYTIKVRGLISSNATPDLDDYSFVLTLKNPCVDPQLNWINIPDTELEITEYLISSSPKSIQGIRDLFSVENDLCGSLTLNFDMADTTEAVQLQDGDLLVYS